MKAINFMNYFFISIPILLISLGLIMNQSNGNLVGYGLLFLIPTGLFQLIFGIKMLIDEPHDKNLQFYIKGVALFFILLLINALIIYNNFISYILYSMPLLLATYFSIIIYKKANQ